MNIGGSTGLQGLSDDKGSTGPQGDTGIQGITGLEQRAPIEQYNYVFSKQGYTYSRTTCNEFGTITVLQAGTVKTSTTKE